MNTHNIINVKNISYLKKIVKQYSNVHVLGTTPFIDTNINYILDIQKVKEYNQIYHSLHALHIGLGNTLYRTQNLAEEQVIPKLFQKCIQHVCGTSMSHSKTLHQCIFSPKWKLLQTFLQLTNSEILSITPHGTINKKIIPIFDNYKNIHHNLYIPTDHIPIALQIPSFQKTFHTLNVYSSLNYENLSMGLIEISEQNTIEKISFIYVCNETTYILGHNESKTLLGKNYPIGNQNDMNDFWNRVHNVFNKLSDTHIARVIQSLVHLINPTLT